jgi:hypothetical protein
MKAVIYFIQCEQCQHGRLLKDCIDVIHLPEEERKHEKGSRMEIKYLKGKSDVLTFRNRATYYDPLAVPNLSDLIKSKAVSKKVPKSIKQYIGKGTHFYSKLSVGEF